MTMAIRTTNSTFLLVLLNKMEWRSFIPEREMIKNFILLKRAGDPHVWNGIATYIGSGGVIKGNYLGDKRKQMRTEFHI